MDIVQLGDGMEAEREYKFSPIVLISPPQWLYIYYIAIAAVSKHT